MGSCCGEVKPDGCKPAASDQLPFRIDLFDYCARRWGANEDVQLGEFARPRTAFGYALQALSDFTTGGSEPAWRGPVDKVIPDGGGSWKVVAAGLNGIMQASAPAVDSIAPADSGDLTADDLAISEGRWLTGVYLNGVKGTSYVVLFSFVVNGLTRVIKHTVAVT